MVGSTLNTQVAYAIFLCRPSEAVNGYAYSDLTGGKTASQRKSSRAEVTSLGNGRAALGPACYFSAFLRLLTNSASQPWAPSAGLSPCQRLKAAQGPCPAIVPVPQRKRAHAVLCCGVWSQEWALPHHPVDVPRVSVTHLWTTDNWHITPHYSDLSLSHEDWDLLHIQFSRVQNFLDFRHSRYQSVDS